MATLFWPAAVVRALSPVRLLAVALGLAVTQALLLIPLAVQQQPISFWQPPWKLVQALVARGSGWTVFWGLILGAVLGAVWGLVGGAIAWLEFRGQVPDPEAPPVAVFLRRKGSVLSGTVLMVLIFVSFLIVLGWVAAGINALLPWGIGATLLAIILPVLMLLGFAVAICAVGCLALPLMASVPAAEGSDSFEAISRGFSYLFQRPLEFALWWGLAVVLAGLPLAGVLNLVQGEKPLLGPDVRPVLLWVGLVVSLSLFWSLQPLVYVKMRWLVDDTEETELWSGREEKAAPGAAPPVPDANPAPPDPAGPPPATELTKDETAPAEPEPEKLTPAHNQVTFAQTLTLGNAGAPNKMVGLLPGVAWTALVLAGGLWVGSRLVDGGADWTPAGLRELVRKLAQQRPLALALLFLAVVVVSSVGLGRWLRMIARMVAVRAVYEQEISLAGLALPFARRSGNQGLVSVVLLSAAVVLFLVALPLGYLVWLEPGSWPEPVCLLAAALVLGGLGALGLGAVSVDGRRLEEQAISPLATHLGNGAEVLASALAAVVMGVARWVVLLGLAFLTWVFVCESLGWAGGDARWVRWGYDGHLAPEVQGPLYWFASRIAGLWFFVLAGTVLSYPLSYLLRWGVVSYLRPASRPSWSRPSRWNWTMRNEANCFRGKRSGSNAGNGDCLTPGAG